MKKLAVFFDGTWNREDQHDRNGRSCPTNITKLFEAALPADKQDMPQLVQYIRGVGTRQSERLKGGGFGYGISDNIKEGYRFLVSNYETGDEIFIFGFSRGAYAARSLAGLIRNSGILKREKIYLIDRAYEIYKDKSPDWHPDASAAQAFRQEHTRGNETVKFLGVFDTVGALGMPFGVILGSIADKLFKTGFHDTQLSSIIESAYHALAVDERRLPFQPTLMSPGSRHNPSNFEQQWFPGVHSNIGGGYDSTGLSDLALEWMAGKAAAQGLNLDLGRISNPAFSPDVQEMPRNSLKISYRILTVLLVKLPGLAGWVPDKYKNVLPDLTWTGEYVRPIADKGNIQPFIGNPPAQPVQEYTGSLDSSVIQKINHSNQKYRPSNVIDK
ncbi:DUF2235 domain-containing protein [Nitrosomonas sp.]|uniref:DUF2235 domain-containing protein n=1 Tax=Nitrosomonas sp. TaxID=42353 RepID=UPI0025D49DA2|nr:DUF2235 domain-containing protein [Nitrosomonas sp.]MCC6916787.1 DUF2235 domain-containing protein [Nitrosomonas sp.]